MAGRADVPPRGIAAAVVTWDVLAARALAAHREVVRRTMARHAGYPAAVDPDRVGKYPAHVAAGGGFVWDEVLEYRVWCHPERGASDSDGGNDRCYCFATYPEAHRFSRSAPGAEEPLALIKQREYIEEPEPGRYLHIRRQRITEWPVEFLRRPRRTPRTIPDFLSPAAPSNRLDILRGLAKRPAGRPDAPAPRRRRRLTRVT
jgi:hypothetical protein